jgi:O-antigen/teichoic acid export membrane protein
MYQKIHDEHPKEICKVAYPAMMMIAGLNLILILLAPEVVKLFAPVSYYDAIYVIPPVAMGVYFLFVYNVFVPFEFYYEKTKYIAVSSVGAAALNVLLNYVFIHLYGYRAAGYTTLACYVLLAVFHYVFMRKVCKEKLDNPIVFDLKIIVSLSVLFVVIGFFLLLLYPYAIIRYGLVGICIIVALLKRKDIIRQFKKIAILKKSK